MSPVSALLVAHGSPQPDRPSPKLVKAAQEFEAILLSQWLEKMQKTFSSTDQAKDPAHDTLASMGTQAVATALASRGGIGIGSMLLRQLKSSPAEQQRAVGVAGVAGQALTDEGNSLRLKFSQNQADIPNTQLNRE